MQHSISDILSKYGDPHKERYLLALSGGVDSMLLAELLLAAGLDFEAVHCNFNLRGEAADDDEVFVQQWCDQHGINLHHCSFDTQNYADQKGLSIQMAARELRYNFFEKLLSQHELDQILTAHHLDDALETSLMNLGRGGGLRAIAGIPPKRDRVIRPLLYFSKEQILTEAKTRKIQWREDASNSEEKYQRNYIRHQVVPLFIKAFPHLDQSFAHTHRILSAENKTLEYFLQRELESLLSYRSEQTHLRIEALKPFPEPGVLLYHWLAPLGFHEWEDIQRAIFRPSGQYFEGEDHVLLFTREAIILQKKLLDDAPLSCSIDEKTEAIDQPLPIRFMKTSADLQQISSSPLEAYLDFDKLEFPLTLRPWKAGDSFKPLGMKSRKKLSDFLTDKKLNRLDKQKVWVLLSGNEIAWVVGHRISEEFKINHKTKSIYFAVIK